MTFEDAQRIVRVLVTMALRQIADQRGDLRAKCDTDDYWAVEPMDGNKQRRIQVTFEYPPMATCSDGSHGAAVDDVVRFVILYPLMSTGSDRFSGRLPFWFESPVASSSDQQIAIAKLIAHVTKAIDSL